MNAKIISRCAVIGVLAACLAGVALAGALGAGQSPQTADRVLLISPAGMHAFDLERFVAAHPTSTLAALTKRSGVFYDDSWDQALTPAGSDARRLAAADTVKTLPRLGL